MDINNFSLQQKTLLVTIFGDEIINLSPNITKGDKNYLVVTKRMASIGANMPNYLVTKS